MLELELDGASRSRLDGLLCVVVEVVARQAAGWEGREESGAWRGKRPTTHDHDPPIGHEHVPTVSATDKRGLHARELRVACVFAHDVWARARGRKRKIKTGHDKNTQRTWEEDIRRA